MKISPPKISHQLSEISLIEEISGLKQLLAITLIAVHLFNIAGCSILFDFFI